jgi:aromatic-L-amino-acid decarboxylase
VSATEQVAQLPDDRVAGANSPMRQPKARMPEHLAPQPHLDPEDWEEFRRASHRALDDMIDHLATVRDRKVWQPASPAARAHFQRPLPQMPQSLDQALVAFNAFIKPYANGNDHPLFMGWVHGAGTPVGMIAEMLAAGLNSNCGGRNHIGIDVERQIAAWAAQMFGFPTTASGIFVTGTSAANHIAMLVARNAALGDDIRQRGLREADHQLTVYTSAEAHSCIVQATEITGIGSHHLRKVPVDGRGAMSIDHLANAIRDDRSRKLQPFMVVGTAGTVNTGAIDDLRALADLCRAERLWFHVDGAFGALCALAPTLRPLIAGIERADSVAFDFHKWAHVPYDAGFVLVETQTPTAAPSVIRPLTLIAALPDWPPATYGRATWARIFPAVFGRSRHGSHCASLEPTKSAPASRIRAAWPNTLNCNSFTRDYLRSARRLR